jgi:hypothetical protein
MIKILSFEKLNFLSHSREAVFRIGTPGWSRIQEVKNDPQKLETVQKYHVLKCWMFSFDS